MLNQKSKSLPWRNFSRHSQIKCTRSIRLTKAPSSSSRMTWKHSKITRYLMKKINSPTSSLISRKSNLIWLQHRHFKLAIRALLWKISKIPNNHPMIKKLVKIQMRIMNFWLKIKIRKKAKKPKFKILMTFLITLLTSLTIIWRRRGMGSSQLSRTHISQCKIQLKFHFRVH